MVSAELTFVYTFLLGALGLALTILAGREWRWHCYRALALFLLSLCVILSGPLIFAQFPAARYAYIAAIVPAWLLLFPCFYLYTRGLTSQVPWRFTRHSVWHFVPACISCVLSVSLLQLSESALFNIFFAEGNVELAADARLTVWLIITVMLFWPLQSLVYVIKTWRHLLAYRRQLHAVFASTKERELGWLGIVLTLMVFTWGWLALTLVQDLSAQPTFLREGGVATLTTVTTWLLLYWSLRQKPGFDKVYPLTEQSDKSHALSDEVTEQPASAKYQHSALSDEQANRIARKIYTAVVTEKLYLEPDLTLYKLAEYLKVSANYVSQTLNQTLGQSFFDYVNKARIDAAAELLRANDKTVLDIAMAVGFNARSSFYKAFKTHTGMTPGEYKKHTRANT
ncbi:MULTISPECIES: helix-turn-helix transcriptional regulator [unclassified Pseudoalteromonas]|uniref:helix-turn-helix domain-containing protein n=1 Tax=unclassified Pseudoalteromonas TaxID=194690 RepID=UPI002097A2D9|nr:helix-turn-helix transcriptional regulator [Pseudoalteromonas sp. XMcav2-N]MCO7187159.1 helix-turn-helix transcriptional regulator [Pseudoalteromonas sp. XMcav2-N]